MWRNARKIFNKIKPKFCLKRGKLHFLFHFLLKFKLVCKDFPFLSLEFFCSFSRLSYFADRVEISLSAQVSRLRLHAANNSRLFFNLLDCPDYFSFSFGKLFSLYPPHLAWTNYHFWVSTWQVLKPFGNCLNPVTLWNNSWFCKVKLS